MISRLDAILARARRKQADLERFERLGTLTEADRLVMRIEIDSLQTLARKLATPFPAAPGREMEVER